LSVAKIVQSIDELAIGQRLTPPDLQGAGKHTRENRGVLTVQAGVDQPCEADVVIPGHHAQDRN
jgi:hypothetical protein